MNTQVWWGYTIDYVSWDCPKCGNHNEYDSNSIREDIAQCMNCNFCIEDLEDRMGDTDSIEDNYYQEEEEEEE